MKKKIILDCDPGHDDMVAIMLAVSHPDIDLLGITTVAGNQVGEKTFQNALKILTLIREYNIPVARGFDKPLLRELTTAPSIHGVSGLDGADLPLSEIKGLEVHAVDFIIDTLKNSKEKIYLVPTGPLTNIAVALFKEPKIKEKIERIVLMGGAVFDSNITPSAEFNIYVDPESAKIVFESGVPITMIGLDVTNKALFTFDDIEKLRKGGRISKIVADLLKFFANANKEFFGFNGAPLHDAVAVAEVIDPTIVKKRKFYVEIETKSELTRGRTVVDYYNVLKKEPNVEVAVEIDLERFKDLIFSALKTLDERCS
ncbi:MAG: nucleoside hydrolase [Dictyoglomaceae bacterium]